VRSLHIVWDWNGTLLDDLDIVVESLNVGTARFGVPSIDHEGYRDHFTRPVRGFYDSLFGRPISDMEWDQLNKSFHDEYYARVERATLTLGARDAIDRVVELGWSQSLLSMSIHDHLLEMVSSHGIADRFVSVDGIRSNTGGLKADHLATHLDSLRKEPTAVLLIGDTPDDAMAARGVGAAIVLYDGGSHHLDVLHALGAPVAYTLGDALDLAVRLAEGETLEAGV
jgi:phosphoglycolate phosphatase-like HAD superfamily hydrolase